MLSKLAVRRLTKLKEYMRSLPKSAEKHFDMRAFADHEGMHDHKFPEVISKKELTLCGTTACALGWASTIPSFRRAGLKLEFNGYDFELLWKDRWLSFGCYDDENIIEIFPGITAKQARDLFGGNVKTKTPKQWAKRCEAFLKDKA